MKINDDLQKELSLQNLRSLQENQEDTVSSENQKASFLKCIVLILGTALMFGNNYSFDNPQALQSQLIEQLDITISQFNLLYSGFAFPNIFLTLVGGVITNILGVRTALIGFGLAIVIAQLIISFGGLYQNFWVMLIGRIIFGTASENLLIAQTTIIGKWFRGKELSTAIGYVMAIPEFACGLNSFITPIIYNSFGHLAYPLFFSAFLCFLSFICGVALCILDKKNDQKQLELNQEVHTNDKVSFSDIKNFTPTFWTLIIVCALQIGSYTPFLDNANDFLQQKFEFTYLQSGRLLTLTYLAASILSPLIGPYVDQVGKRRLFILATCVSYILTHFLFGIMKSNHEGNPNYVSIIPLILLGLSYSMYCCIIIPTVQYAVPQRVVGTAFGFVGMFTNTAMTLFPLVAAQLVQNSLDAEQGYSFVGYFYCGISIIGLGFTISLYYFDTQHSSVLDFVNPESPNTEEQEMLKSQQQGQKEKLIEI
ncbi:unnamed protein product [Paramecium octaurelia]|uniref:Major facilitator superfamily (MFS) profile domain-containing protein n=1 Tax=Paramecium octaurelia TaxID=43137 RepID=A0A8S1V8A7_PAROT|nr:unnamed protein product [Paramecium octaurelia]